MEEKNKEFAKNVAMKEVYTQRFKQTMGCIREIFPYGFHKTNSARTITRVRFESIAIGTWWAIRDKNGNINKLKRDKVAELLADKKYQDILRADGGNVPTKLKQRLEFVRKYLTGE